MHCTIVGNLVFLVSFGLADVASIGKSNGMYCSKTCLATVLIRSIFAREKLHERFSASAVFQRKIERINTEARHVLL